MSLTHNLKEQILSQNPTDQQKEAIFADDLEYLLRASPGSGKTWTACRRFIWRGANWHHKVGGIALLSFTNTAIREFHEATLEAGRRDLLSEPNFVGTLDSFVDRFLLTPFGHLPAGLTKRPKCFTDAHAVRLRGRVFSTRIQFGNGNTRPVEAYKLTPMLKAGQISYGYPVKSGQLAEVKVLSKEAPQLALLKAGYYSHEQRKFWAYYLLKERTDICRILARKFPEIIVDEAQDTNEWLLECLKALRSAGSKVTLIGDPDQCIYEFSRASPDSLGTLRSEWGIRELPLSRSFRCNDDIAAAARIVGQNAAFTGSGKPRTCLEGAFITCESKENFGPSISSFVNLLGQVGIEKRNAAILCRGHSQIESIGGSASSNPFQGQTWEFAHAAFLRDCKKDLRGAFRCFERALCGITRDDPLWEKLELYEDSAEAMSTRLALWRFVKSRDGLPPIGLSGDDWISLLKERLEKLILEIGIDVPTHIGRKIRRNGTADELRLPIFGGETSSPPLRTATVHQVKGESIDAVLLLGPSTFFNSVVKAVNSNANTEERRLAYVAMTRARRLLLIGLPSTHYTAHKDKWINWGFKII